MLGENYQGTLGTWVFKELESKIYIQLLVATLVKSKFLSNKLVFRHALGGP